MNNNYNFSDFSESVIQKVADYLFSIGIAHDTGDCCVYFNDTDNKETYRINLEKCEFYEGD